MNTFLTVLRQDLVAIRWTYLGWIATTVALVLLPKNYAQTDFTNLIDYAHLFGLITWFVLGAVTFTRVTLGHSPVDPHNGWRTRPLRPLVVGIEKLVLGEVLFLVPLVIGPLASGTEASFPEAALILLTALFVACHVSTPRTLLLAMLVTGTLGPLSFILLRSSDSVLFPLPQGFSATGKAVAKVIFGVGLVSLTLHHFRRPHVVGHLLGAGIVLLTIGSMRWVFPDPEIPPPLLDRPEMRLSLVDAHSISDAETPGADYLNRTEARLPERLGKTRTLRNWAVRLKVDGLAQGELWFVRHLNPGLVHPHGSYRWVPDPVYFPTTVLLNQLRFPRDTTFIEPVDDTFNGTFQWLRFDGQDDFPEAPSISDFEVQLYRLNHLAIIYRGPLTVGQHRPQFQITAVNPAAGTFEAVALDPSVELRYGELRSTVRYYLRYSSPTLLVFNPKTKQAGYAHRVSPTPMTFRPMYIDAPQAYHLPALSGDPADWQVLFFIGLADAQAILYGDPENSP